MDRERQGQTRRFTSDLLLSQHRCSVVPDGDFREQYPNRFNDAATGGPDPATPRTEIGLEGEETEMKRASQQKPRKQSSLGDKLLRSAQQARDWVQGKPVRVRVTYVPAPQVDVRKLRARMGLSQTQFAAKFGFSLDSIQNWEQGHRQPEGPARVLLVVIAKNPKAVEEALRSS
jgi:putative transcriptional regulator